MEELVNRPLGRVHYTGQSAGAGEGTRSPAVGLVSLWQDYLHPRGAEPAPWGLPCPFHCLGQAAGPLQGELFLVGCVQMGFVFPAAGKPRSEQDSLRLCPHSRVFTKPGWLERAER